MGIQWAGVRYALTDWRLCKYWSIFCLGLSYFRAKGWVCGSKKWSKMRKSKTAGADSHYLHFQLQTLLPSLTRL